MFSATKATAFLPAPVAAINSCLKGTRSTEHVKALCAGLVYDRGLAEPNTVIVYLPYLIHSV